MEDKKKSVYHKWPVEAVCVQKRFAAANREIRRVEPVELEAVNFYCTGRKTSIGKAKLKGSVQEPYGPEFS